MKRCSKINIFNILKCLFWKQIKIQRYVEIIVSLCFCLIIWLVAETEDKEPPEKAKRSVGFRSQNNSFEEVFYFPVSNLTNKIMNNVCSQADCKIVGINNTLRSMKQRKPSNIALTFHSNDSNNLNFTISTHQNRIILNTKYWQSKAQDFQKRIQHSFLHLHGANWHNFRLGVKSLKYRFDETTFNFFATSIRILDNRIIKTLLFKLAFVFIVKTVKDVMLERQTLMKYMILSCNVPEIFIWLGYVIQRMITNVFIAFVIALILKDYEVTKWYIIWSFLSLFCLCGIIQAFLISCITEDYNINILMMIISWFMVYPLYAPGKENCLYYCIWPCYALQLGYQMMDEAPENIYVSSDNWSSQMIFESMDKPELFEISVIMLFDVLWMSLLTYFLNRLRRNK